MNEWGIFSDNDVDIWSEISMGRIFKTSLSNKVMVTGYIYQCTHWYKIGR